MEFHIDGMTCGGCARKVTNAIRNIDQDATVAANPATRQVQVQTSASEARIAAALKDAGFPPREE